MNQTEFYAACAAILILFMILLFTMAFILKKHRGSKDTRHQSIRMILLVLLLCSVIGTAFFMLSFHIETTTVRIQRDYENQAIDGEALMRAEAFNYSAIIGGTEFEVIPPYNYENTSYFVPFINLNGQGDTNIEYNATITHPNATMNMTSLVKSDMLNFVGPYPLWYSIAAETNGTWALFELNETMVSNVTWLFTVQYSIRSSLSSSCSWGENIHIIVALNQSRDVMFIAREIQGLFHPCPSFFILPVIIIIGLIFFVFSIVFVIEIDFGFQSFKKAPRRVTAENVMENETRQEIVKAIHDHPGIIFAELNRRIMRSPRTLLEHLGILQRFGVVRSRDFRHNTVFFEANLAENEEIPQYFLANIKFNNILRALQSKPGTDFTTLQKVLVDSRSALMRKVKVLEKYRIITITRKAGRIVAIDIAIDELRDVRRTTASDGDVKDI